MLLANVPLGLCFLLCGALFGVNGEGKSIECTRALSLTSSVDLTFIASPSRQTISLHYFLYIPVDFFPTLELHGLNQRRPTSRFFKKRRIPEWIRPHSLLGRMRKWAAVLNN